MKSYTYTLEVTLSYDTEFIDTETILNALSDGIYNLSDDASYGDEGMTITDVTFTNGKEVK
jgi:hypothetical protein